MLDKTKNAFTLAEVLITLVIIGIVAALTIPPAINHYKERVTIEKIKSSYAILSTAYRLAQMENGPKYSEWNCDSFQDWSNGSKYSNCMTYYIKKHLKRVKDCSMNLVDCFDVDESKRFSIDGSTFDGLEHGGGDMFILSNGVPVLIYRRQFFYIKTDNSKKLVFNKNLFFFYARDNDDGLLPFVDAWSSMNSDTLKRGIYSDIGMTFSAVKWIFTKDNMDYLH